MVDRAAPDELTPCPLTFAAERINPYERQNPVEINLEIEALYKFITSRYTVAFDMLVVLLSNAATIGYEAFQQGDAGHLTPRETLHSLLNDMIDQYENNQRKKVH